MIGAAGKSAPGLVDLVAQTFPGFRAATVDPHDGRQVFLYKRAQIFVGACGVGSRAEVWGFRTPSGLTMFADYRVPVVLRSMGVLKYDDALAAAVDSGDGTIAAGSVEEIEIRSCTVQAWSG